MSDRIGAATCWLRSGTGVSRSMPVRLGVAGLLAGLLVENLCAAPEVVWKHDYGAAKVGPLFKGVKGLKVVKDRVAKAGKSLELVYGRRGRLRAIATTKDLRLAGRGTVRVWVRGKDLNDVANGLRLNVALNRQTTPGRRFQACGAVYGVRVSKGTYRVLPIDFEVGDQPAPYRLSISPFWQAQKGKRTPTVWISRIELEAHGSRAPYISGVRRTRFMCAPGGEVKVAVTLVNPLKEACRVKLVAEDLAGLAGKRRAAETAVSLAPGQSRVVDMAWKAAGPEVGHEIVFVLSGADGKELDRDRADVGIATDGRLLHLPTHDFESGAMAQMSAGLLYVYPASHTQSKNIIVTKLRDRNNRGGRLEFFSWSWCDLAGFIPPEDPYLGNAEHQWWLSLKEYKEQIAMMKSAGVHTVSYILGCALGQAAYDLYQKHPDWFRYDRNGAGFDPNMETHARYARRHEFEFVQDRRHCVWAGMDPTRPGVRRWIADQIISLGKEMGFQGARWDVWMMNVAPGDYRLDGTQIAPTWKEADRLSTESLKAVKDMVAKALPDFTWGYNGSGPDWNKKMPLFLAERCKGGAWMLDEGTIMYGAKTSPYHYWKAYSKRFVEWGDRIRQLGGIYDPWPFDRGFNGTNANHIEVDWLHSTIFRILAGGRAWPPLYRNDSALVGDLPRLAFRQSDTYSGWNLRLQPEDQTRIAVTAPATLWWKGYVFSNKAPDGRAQAIVHLVNSPPVKEVRENPDSKVRPAVRNVTVQCRAARGRLPKKAWLLMAEPMTPDGEAKVQAVPLRMTKRGGGAVSVTIPAVLYLKTVVFEF